MKKELKTKNLETSELLLGEQLVLCGIRIWVQSFKIGDKSKRLLLRGLQLAGVAGSYAPTDNLMITIAYAANRSVEVNCIGSSNITIDEHLIMDAIAFWMEKDELSSPQFSTFDFLPLAAAREAERYFFEIAHCFKNAGYILRRRPTIKPRDPLKKPLSAPTNPSATIH